MSSEKLFSVLKYILIVFNALFIVVCLFILIIGKELIEIQDEQQDSTYKSLYNKSLIFIILISIVFHSIGIIGAMKEHLRLTLTYAIIMTIFLVLEATQLPARSLTFLFHLFIAGCAYSYAALINRMEIIHMPH